MPNASGSTVVAIINTSPDVVELLRAVLERAGIIAVSALTHDIRDGRVDLEQLLHTHDPDVVVYDIAPPYEPNWKLFQHLCRTKGMQSRQFVMTSANAQRLQELVGSHQQVYEIVGKPFDLDEVVRAVKEAGRARPTR